MDYRKAITSLIEKYEIIHHGELIAFLFDGGFITRGSNFNATEMNDVIDEMAGNYELKVVYYSLPSDDYGDVVRVKRILLHPKAEVWSNGKF